MTTFAAAAVAWSLLNVNGAGFTIEVPGPATPGTKPDQYSYSIGDSGFIVESEVMDDDVHAALLRGDRARLKTYLETLLDNTLAALKAKGRIFSNDDYEGHPSIVFWADGTLE